MGENKVMEEIWLENNLESFFFDFSPLGKYSILFDHFIFRGERTDKFSKLLPSSLREDPNSINKLYNYAQTGIDYSHTQHKYVQHYQQAELGVLMNFYKAANFKGLNLPDIRFFRKYSFKKFLSIDNLRYEIGEKWLPDDFLELAALAQHYGLPTRLIDWSKDLYTSLYFASTGAMHANDQDTKYMVLYALDYFTLESLKGTTNEVPLRLVIPEHHKNQNLNYQKGILTAWEYKTIFNQDVFNFNDAISHDVDKYGYIHHTMEYDSLEILIQKYIDLNGISFWDLQPLIYKFYLPVEMASGIYSYISKMGYGADRLFSGFEGISKMLEDQSLLET